MLLFRSEEHVGRWSERRGHSMGAMLTPDQGWRLAKEWYADRLSPNWARKTPDEAQAVFDSIGLAGPFWAMS